MSHPSNEEWMSFLYEELDQGGRADLAAHLAVCPDCKAKVAEWRGAMSELNTWRYSVNRWRRRNPGSAVARWAVAAILMLAAGFLVGRGSSPTPDIEALRAAIEPSIRQQLRQELAQTLQSGLDRAATETLAASSAETTRLLAQFANAVEDKRVEDNRAYSTALKKIESQRVADYVNLRKDLETVAVSADLGFRRTQQRFVELADYRPPAGHPTSPER